ncbi:hypothetical protein L1049_017486 [Liquidambar formosana]|uniref:WW domain-containing protein n=1 Tax=Liquidambar formosana TaxID=63359 RepID=A0AAP0X888_LIQFO
MKHLFQHKIDPNKEDLKKSQQFWKMKEHPELSFAPTQSMVDKSMYSSSSEYETFPSRKRKSLSDHLLKTEPMIQTSVDLQLKDPLPVDWEQCLDLQSGKMYYLNRKTLRKSWEWPKDQQVDLELNISTLSSSSDEKHHCEGGSEILDDDSEKLQYSSSSTTSNMVALACLNCHLLVILSRSSPSCPNCKYVHSLPTQQIPPPKNPAINSLDTLSLLN